METEKTLILNDSAIEQKVQRIAYQILEENYKEKEIILIGIKNQGYSFANKIHAFLSTITKTKISVFFIALNKETPVDEDIEYDFEPKQIKNKSIILVDDVANSGRTLCYAIRVLLPLLPNRIQTAVLVDRKHKLFPICADYVGLSLATTMKEHVAVKFGKKEAVYLCE